LPPVGHGCAPSLQVAYHYPYKSCVCLLWLGNLLLIHTFTVVPFISLHPFPFPTENRSSSTRANAHKINLAASNRPPTPHPSSQPRITVSCLTTQRLRNPSTLPTQRGPPTLPPQPLTAGKIPCSRSLLSVNPAPGSPNGIPPASATTLCSRRRARRNGSYPQPQALSRQHPTTSQRRQTAAASVRWRALSSPAVAVAGNTGRSRVRVGWWDSWRAAC
jgi:hypothetical protein